MSARVVIRGSGSIGRRHAEVFRSLGSDVTVWPARSGGDDEVRAATSDADLAVIATDTSRHVSDAVEALDLGARRVLVEKPVAPTASAALPLAAHPRSADVFIAAPLRAHECLRVVRDLLPELGAPLSAQVVCQSWLPDWRPDRDYRQSYSARRSEGGVLRDLVHEIDYAVVLFGPPEAAAAVLDRHGPLEIEAEQAADLLWRTASATVALRLDYISRPARRALVATGPDGRLEWDLTTATVRHRGPEGGISEWGCPADLDRNVVMARQAGAALALAPGAPEEARLAAGAPASLAEGCRAVAICDDARAVDLGKGAL